MTHEQTVRSGIYLIRNRINGKIYVGSSVQMKKRWKRHLYDLKVGKHTNPKLQNAFLKYGISAFTFEILCHEPNPKLLIGLEDTYINSLKPAYNCKMASDTGRVDGNLSFCERISKATKGIKHSEEHKKRIGEAHKGLKRSPEACANIGNASRGRRHSEETKTKIGQASLGHILTDEVRAKIGAAHKGRVVSIETRARLSDSLKGRVISDEWRANMSAAKRGRKFTDEHRAKLSAATKGHVVSEETRQKIRFTKMMLKDVSREI